MIHYLKIRNFGPIKDEVEMSFEVAEGIESDAYEVSMPDGRRLLKLAYIYGANASGKTSVLNAFGFLRDLLLNPLEKKTDKLNFDPFLFCADPYRSTSFFEISFYQEGVRYVYEVNFNNELIISERLFFYKTAKPTELFNRETDLEKKLSKIQFSSNLKVPARDRDLFQINTLHNNTVFGAFLKINIDFPVLDQLSNWFKQYLLSDLGDPENLNAVTTLKIDKNPAINAWMNTFLNKADPQIVEVNVPDLKTQLTNKLKSSLRLIRLDGINKDNYFTMSTEEELINPGKNAGEFEVNLIHRINEKQRYTLPLNKESKGTQRYYSFGGPLYDLIHGQHFLCIDELENSLHADLMKHFLQLFLMNAGSSQLLITTHNLSLMEDSDFIRRDALWFTEKGDDGGVSLYAASDFDTTTLRKDASLINAYKAGRLGAKPNLGSPYMRED